MESVIFKYVTENDDQIIWNHFKRNTNGEFECQHCDLVFDNIDKPTMAKHLRRKHPMATKARLEKAAHVNQAEENPTNNREPMENEKSRLDDTAQANTGRATTHCERTPEEAEHILNVFADPNGEYKRIGQYSSDEELNESRKKLGFVIQKHRGTITYYHCKNYGGNKPKEEWCHCLAESFNSLLYQRGEHVKHCSYRGLTDVNNNIGQQPDNLSGNQIQQTGEGVPMRVSAASLIGRDISNDVITFRGFKFIKSFANEKDLNEHRNTHGFNIYRKLEKETSYWCKTYPKTRCSCAAKSTPDFRFYQKGDHSASCRNEKIMRPLTRPRALRSQSRRPRTPDLPASSSNNAARGSDKIELVTNQKFTESQLQWLQEIGTRYGLAFHSIGDSDFVYHKGNTRVDCFITNKNTTIIVRKNAGGDHPLKISEKWKNRDWQYLLMAVDGKCKTLFD